MKSGVEAGQRGARRSWIWIALALGGAMLLLAGTRAAGRRAATEQLEQVAVSLRRVHAEAQLALDAARAQQQQALYALEFMERGEGSSSAGVVDALKALRFPAAAPVPLAADGLSAEQLRDIPDPELRRAVQRLEWQLNAAAAAAAPAHDHYRLQLDALLPAGLWRSLNGYPTEARPVDYRAALALLRQAHLEGSLRSVVLETGARAQQLESLLGASAAAAEHTARSLDNP